MHFLFGGYAVKLPGTVESSHPPPHPHFTIQKHHTKWALTSSKKGPITPFIGVNNPQIPINSRPFIWGPYNPPFIKLVFRGPCFSKAQYGGAIESARTGYFDSGYSDATLGGAAPNGINASGVNGVSAGANGIYGAYGPYGIYGAGG